LKNDSQKCVKILINYFNRKSKFQDYENQIFKSKDYHGFGQGIKMKEGEKIEETFFWLMKVGKGCLIVVQELYINCNGWFIKTGQFKFKAKQLKKDDD